MESLRVLLAMSLISVCHGGKLEMLVKKMYGMEESIHQDIGLLRESIEDNKQALESILGILNNSKVDAGLTESRLVMAGSKDNEENAHGHLKEDVERVKRAFVDEKVSSRERDSKLKIKLDKLGEQITQNLNNISNVMNNIEDKVSEARNTPTGPTNEELAGMMKSFTERQNEDLARMMKGFAESQDIQTITLTNIYKLIEKIASITVKNDVSMANGLQELSEKLDVLSRTGIKLVDGFRVSHNQGRVEILHDGQWGTVCDDNFDDTDATVVCRSLGYSNGKFRSAAGYFGKGSGKIWLDDVRCDGTEESLIQCKSNTIGSHDCTHGEDVGVICT